ncbi:C-type lectin domain family 18 member A [Elysia marginata]|uniref:C-type lectin domain family 18 member A n=1 Tax=Elysia marginata TaxID=1093978 RepID=A0AAV4GVX2_9GAST|nr:C-type lectin domain family 18 member A [Elysia marginata]
MLFDSFGVSDGKDKCKEEGGQLLEINSQAENDFVTNYLRSISKLSSIPLSRFGPFRTRSIWLGATDESSEGDFRLMSTNQQLGFHSWMDGEPNNSSFNGGAENCVVLESTKDYTWNDVTCDFDHAVVCESTEVSDITG